VIRHVAFEDLGTLAIALDQHHYQITTIEAGRDPICPMITRQPDLLIVLGGPIGAYEEADYPFLTDELKWLESRFQADLPVLGICLGAQLMARALGAAVYPSGSKELGWAPVTLTAAGQQSALKALDPGQTEVLHWHGDTFDLPSGATRLASTALCPNQAFFWGGNSLGLQFHPEVTAAGLERWWIGHALEIAGTPGITVAQLRAETAVQAPQLERQAAALWTNWFVTLSDPKGEGIDLN
jgi:GMP synthase (glutamine-hydrolysing)